YTRHYAASQAPHSLHPSPRPASTLLSHRRYPSLVTDLRQAQSLYPTHSLIHSFTQPLIHSFNPSTCLHGYLTSKRYKLHYAARQVLQFFNPFIRSPTFFLSLRYATPRNAATDPATWFWYSCPAVFTSPRAGVSAPMAAIHI